jgi:hypothetical protein
VIRAAANAIVALGRIGHEPVLEEARRILELSPDGCPAELRAASAFSYGRLAPTGGKASDASKMFGIYESIYESSATKFEALKALGNLRHAPAAARLQSIAREQASIELRWIAHWSWQRCSGTKAAYTPPTERRAPPVSITDTTK